MKRIHSSVCIVGGGPAALFSQVLLRKKGIDSFIVAESVFGNLMTIQIDGMRLSPIPIFVSLDSDLYQRMEWEPLSGEDYVTTKFSPMSTDGVSEEIRPDSYAEFLMQHYSDAVQRLILTKKHIGTGAFKDSFPGLRRKVLSHYPPGHSSAKRVGFCEGLSPYLKYLEQEQLHVELKEAILAIDVAKRCVFTSSHQITFDRLISTLPILDFLSLAGISTMLTTVAASARILVGKTRQAITPNQLIYDCDAKSPVYRVFVPREGVVIAQVARLHWGTDDELITKRVQELFDLVDQPVILERFNIQNCYPLALSDYALRDTIISSLERSGVTLFGRFAEWEYRDIEELMWERIECLS